MNILMVNGSPHRDGCTAKALHEVEEEFKILGDNIIDNMWLGPQMNGCICCNVYKDKKLGHCVFDNDLVNRFIEKAQNADGFIFASPVYYAGITGQLANFMSRVFYSAANVMRNKYAAGITVSRRAGNELAFAHLNSYFLMHSMIVVGSQYWNEVHGDFSEELEHDKEGLQYMRRLAYNMHVAVHGPDKRFEEKRIHTNFISREFLKLYKEAENK